MKYILLSKYYQSISDIKILKKIYDNKNQIQNGQINDEQNKILIFFKKCSKQHEKIK